MVVIKKAFDDDLISLDEFLRTIRSLAKKQCRNVIKINKLVSVTQGAPNPQDARGVLP